MARGFHRLTVIGLLALLALALGCQEHDLGALHPDIVVDPEAVEFGTVTIGVAWAVGLLACGGLWALPRDAASDKELRARTFVAGRVAAVRSPVIETTQD